MDFKFQSLSFINSMLKQYFQLRKLFVMALKESMERLSW